jgi:hypothetical protein
MSDIMSFNNKKRILDEEFTENVSFWPRTLSCDLLSLPSGGSKKALVRLPPTNMLDLFRRGSACWKICEVDIEGDGDDPATAILNNQGWG